jgi:hypothetical protein
VESSCEFRIEPSGSINSGKLSSVITRDLSSSVQLHRVSYIMIFEGSTGVTMVTEFFDVISSKHFPDYRTSHLRKCIPVTVQCKICKKFCVPSFILIYFLLQC